MRESLTVTVLRGIPGSGKTTWAKDRVNEILKNGGKVVRISYDELREMFHNTIRGKENERFMLEAVRTLIVSALNNRYNVIVDGTHLNNLYCGNVQRAVDDYNTQNALFLPQHDYAEIEYQDFDTPLDECIERNSKRENPVPENVIRAMFKKTPSVFGAQALAREALDGPSGPC